MRGDEWYDATSGLMLPGTDLVDIIDALFARPAWQRRAACRGQGTDPYFPERGEPTAPAKAVCAGCVVRRECLDFALTESGTSGIWGGTSERERRMMRRDAKNPQPEQGALAG